jgi:ABC-type transport system involved in multi-copper enzyme maturation permease subunit
MTWLTWRQYRFQLCVAAALLAAFAVVILITGRQIAATLRANAAACAAGHPCQDVAGGGLFMGSHVIGFLVIATLSAPLLFGLFWGAPLVASELDAGTVQFAWMQSITRDRWLAIKAGWLLLAAAVWGGAISALVTWWYSPGVALGLNQFDPGHFDLVDLVPVGYAVFAMALGICAGTLLRRTLPAMAVTLAGFVAVRVIIVLWVRAHYLSAVTVTYNTLGSYTPRGSIWQLASGVIGPNGQPLPQPNNMDYFNNIPQTYLPGSCSNLLGSGASNPTPACARALSHFREFITYQPADRFWTFQLIETGIFVLIAAALLAVTAVVLARRDA